jgi:hypothetical protein
MSTPAIEPQALELRPDDDGRIRLSIAISLKRIADAMNSQAAEGSVLYWLEQIAFATNESAGR